jgi:hypothetical protein
MTSIKTLLFVVILISETASCSGHQSQENSDDPVGLKGREAAQQETSGVQKPSYKAIISDLDLEIIRAFSVPNLYLLKIPDNSTVPDVIERLGQYEDVKYAEPNYFRTKQRKK